MGLLVGWFVSHNEQASFGTHCFKMLWNQKFQVHGIKTWGGKIYAMAIKCFFVVVVWFLVLFWLKKSAKLLISDS